MVYRIGQKFTCDCSAPTCGSPYVLIAIRNERAVLKGAHGIEEYRIGELPSFLKLAESEIVKSILENYGI